MISKRLRESLDSSICIRDIFEEGKNWQQFTAQKIFLTLPLEIRV